jgi:BirA family biotin operon repressor/biotin-[acetyl-CoA-carboxylase] ligase
MDRSEVVRDLIRRLDDWYDASRSRGIEVLNHPWRSQSEHLGRIVRITTTRGGVTGRLVDIDLRLGLTLAPVSPTDQELCQNDTPNLARLPMAEILTLEDAPATS